MQNSLPIKNKLSKINLNCKQIENGKRLYKYNIVVGAGKHVMKDIENRSVFRCFCFLRWGVFPHKLVCGFSKYQILLTLFSV